MVASEFLEYIAQYQVTRQVGVDDVADRLSSVFTVGILLVCTTLVTVKQYFFKPISCYLANDPGGLNLLEFVEYACWVEGTIPRTSHVKTPDTPEEWDALEDKKIMYYQWMPFVLGLQCLMFYIPKLAWLVICYNRAGADLHNLLNSANDAVRTDLEAREKVVMQVAVTMERLLCQPSHLQIPEHGKLYRLWAKMSSMWPLCLVQRRSGHRLALSYLLLKLVYVGNALGQLVALQHFLGAYNIVDTNSTGDRRGTLFGWQVAHNMIAGREWTQSQLFPRVALCFTRVRQMGARDNGITAQCVLPVNMLTEKFYTFLWFWVAFIVIIAALSVPTWSLRLLCTCRSHYFIRRLLRLAQTSRQPVVDSVPEPTSSQVNHFVYQYLRLDGLLLLHMMQLNVGDVITSDVVGQLWRLYLQATSYNKAHMDEREPYGNHTNKWLGGDAGAGDLQAMIPLRRAATVPLPELPTTASKLPVIPESGKNSPSAPQPSSDTHTT